MKRTLTITVATGAALLSLSACGNDVTRARLEQALAPTFTRLFVDQQAMLGHGVTPQAVGTAVSCDKGGPKVADVGPGANWICTISFTDSTGKRQKGRFEVNAHANACYSVGGPGKLIGAATITNRAGADVPNPVAEFDGCFDPAG